MFPARPDTSPVRRPSGRRTIFYKAPNMSLRPRWACIRSSAGCRRLFIPVAAFLAIAAACPAPGHAADKFAAEFLRIGVGARAQGMGGAFVSVADDASAAFWNPAGLVQLPQREAMAMHASQFAGVLSHNFGSVVLPLEGGERRAAVGATVIWLSVDDIRLTDRLELDESGNPIYDPDKIEIKSAYDVGLLLTYSRELSERVSAGVNVKLIRQSLVDRGSSFGIGADIGFLYRPGPRLALGLRLADATSTRLYWDSGRRETVAPTVTVGAHTVRDVAALRGTVLAGLDVGVAFESYGNADQIRSGSLSGNLLPGIEYWYNRVVALRVGSDGGDLTAGAGVRYRQFGVDYAYLDHSDLDSTHRVSALYRF